MRLFFKFAHIDQAAFLIVTQKFGVGAVHPTASRLIDTGIKEKVVKVDANGNRVLDDKQAEIFIEAPVMCLWTGISFDFHSGKSDPAAVRKIAEAAGLEYEGEDDAVTVRWNETKIAPAIDKEVIVQ